MSWLLLYTGLVRFTYIVRTTDDILFICEYRKVIN